MSRSSASQKKSLDEEEGEDVGCRETGDVPEAAAEVGVGWCIVTGVGGGGSSEFLGDHRSCAGGMGTAFGAVLLLALVPVSAQSASTSTSSGKKTVPPVLSACSKSRSMRDTRLVASRPSWSLEATSCKPAGKDEEGGPGPVNLKRSRDQRESPSPEKGYECQSVPILDAEGTVETSSTGRVQRSPSRRGSPKLAGRRQGPRSLCSVKMPDCAWCAVAPSAPSLYLSWTRQSAPSLYLSWARQMTDPCTRSTDPKKK